MAISKLILNGETQMDVTSNTNAANNMLNGVVGTKNDGTTVTGSIATKTSSDLTASGATVTAPAGYYANAASKAVATATHPNPSASIASATGVVTASHTQDTGYVTGGTTTGTLSLTTQAGKTITPTETAQTAVASYRWTTGPISVAAIDSYYIGSRVPQNSAADVTIANTTGVVTAPAGYYSTAATKTLTTKAGETFYPSTADQTISSYRWLIGNQTIASVTTTNLVAQNIAEGVVVKVGDANNASRITQVTGTYSGGSKHTAVITSKTAYRSNIYYNDVEYYVNQPFEFSAGDVCVIQVYGEMGPATIRENGIKIGESNVGDTYKYFYVLPDCDIEISTSPNGYSAYVDIAFVGNIQSVKSVSINQNGTFTLLPDNTINITKDSTYFTYSPSGFKYSAPELSQLVVGETYKLAISFRDSGRQLTGAYYNDNFIFNGYYEDTETDVAQFWINNKLIKMRFYEALTVDGISGYGIYVSGNSNDSDTGSLHMKISKATAMATVSASVDVSGGSFTADDIAMRTITGDISGSATTIGSYAFYYCSALTTASFPSATCIDTYAFAFCSSLTTVSFPSATSIGYSTFYSCSALTTASFPNVTSVGNYAFYYCRSLTTASFPKATYIGMYAFNYCTKLTTVSFPNVTSIGNYAFRSCYNLLSLYLLGSSIPTLAATNAFSSTPISTYTTSTGGVYGSIFVPSSLYSSYLTATNWSVYSNRIVSV